MEQIENNNISSPTTKLNEEQVTQLNYLIEEEKLAHDVYTTLGEKRNNKQFIKKTLRNFYEILSTKNPE